jgi:hypothetical protein
MARRVAKPALEFCGWLKVEDQPWQLAVTGATQAEAERKLLAVEVPPGVRFVSRQALRAGQLPIRVPERRTPR